MNNIVPFSLESQQVRVIDKDDNPWFVAADVCAVLGLGNTSQAMSRLDDDERSTIILNDGTDGNPNQTIISESGMYALVLTSRKPQAKPFRKWVTGEVLPSIRKTGQYQTKTAIKAAYQKGRQDAQQLLPEWQENRTTGKVMRHELTDTIKAFIEYAKAQGSRGADKYYMNITKMLNEAVLGTHASNNPHFRDTLDAGQLSNSRLIMFFYNLYEVFSRLIAHKRISFSLKTA
ncbi:hypothetical protein WCLP8_4290002 [uncultured Gammaproteobacteria bacterium]